MIDDFGDMPGPDVKWITTIRHATIDTQNAIPIVTERTFSPRFLLALSLRANSIHTPLKPLDLESHTRQAEHQRPTQAKRKHQMSRANRKIRGWREFEAGKRRRFLSIDASMIDD